MARSGKHVVFDVVGTCVSYDAFLDAVKARMGDRLRAAGIKPKLFGFAWIEAAEREYSYLDRCGRYMPFSTIFQPMFYRILSMAGVEEPREFATDDDASFLVNSYRGLKARPAIQECHSRLRAAGFTVWAFTTGDVNRVQGYLANNSIDVPSENFVFFDSLSVGKPAAEAYKYLLDKFEGAEETWFAAAHMWDTAETKQNG